MTPFPPLQPDTAGHPLPRRPRILGLLFLLYSDAAKRFARSGRERRGATP